MKLQMREARGRMCNEYHSAGENATRKKSAILTASGNPEHTIHKTAVSADSLCTS